MSTRPLTPLGYACALLLGCGGGAASSTAFVDSRDGHMYSRVKVGDDTWMGENLAWEAPSGSFCYMGDAASCASGGRLYTFAVAAVACPTGWHLSTDADWKRLETSLGMPMTDLDFDYYAAPRGNDEGTKLKVGGSSGLDFPLTGYAELGSDGAVATWAGLGVHTYLWTPASADPSSVLRRRLEDSSPKVFRFSNPAEGYAVTVRCVADANVPK
jgi:uncharacterized protein (TIGR02145 family)